MQNSKNRLSSAFCNFGCYAFFVAIAAALFLLLDQTLLVDKYSGYDISRLVVTFTLLSCAAVGGYLYEKKKLSAETAVALIFIASFVIKVMYSLKNSYNWYQHDVESLDTAGHLSYIYRFVTGQGLPDSNEWQFYHPPLHHYISALSVKLSLSLGFSLDRAFENIQLLTAVYSQICCVLAYKLFKELGAKGASLVGATALVAFHPTMIILSGSINNDVLTLMLMMLSVLLLVRWCNNPKWSTTLLLALSTGLAVMTKFSAVLIAATVGVVVLIYQIVKKRIGWGEFAAKAVAFTGIVFPLGMWYQIRSAVKFSQPIGYVAPLSTDSALYCGDVSLVRRLLPDFTQLDHLFCHPFGDWNLPIYTLKCSVFGEYDWGNHYLAGLLLALNIVMIALSGVAAVRLILIRDKKFFNAKLVLSITWLLQVAFFVYFNISSPFGCTMDFRYIVPTLFCGAGVLSMLGVINKRHGICGALNKASLYACCAFVLVSVLFYM